jgi:hypothetical protein
MANAGRGGERTALRVVVSVLAMREAVGGGACAVAWLGASVAGLQRLCLQSPPSNERRGPVPSVPDAALCCRAARRRTFGSPRACAPAAAARPRCRATGRKIRWPGPPRTRASLRPTPGSSPAGSGAGVVVRQSWMRPCRRQVKGRAATCCVRRRSGPLAGRPPVSFSQPGSRGLPGARYPWQQCGARPGLLQQNRSALHVTVPLTYMRRLLSTAATANMRSS